MPVALPDSSLPTSNTSFGYDTYSSHIDYSCVLDEFGLTYKSVEYYWQVGSLKAVQGWILHLSVVSQQIIDLLHLVVPIFIQQAVSFKIIRDTALAEFLLEGQLGSRYLGKVIVIYPEGDRRALDLARILISATKAFIGPIILTDKHLGGIVYTRYGSFNPVYQKGPDGRQIKHIYNIKGELVPDPYSIPFAVEKSIEWPFQEICSFMARSRSKLLYGKYYPVSVIKNDAKGNVTRAIYLRRNTLKISSCVIKEGRQNLIYDDHDRDMRDRIKWQYELYHRLSQDTPLPKMIDYFEDSGDSYIAMEFIHGTSFVAVLQNSYKGVRWQEIAKASQLKLVDYLKRIISIIQRLHKRGFIHRDITPENFLIDKNDQLWLIDIELMFSVVDEQPYPPFGVGTPGFTSPQQERGERPTDKEDIYALGALLLTTFTNLPPGKFDTHSSEMLKDSLFFFTENRMISDLIAECLRKEPAERPDLIKMHDTLDLYQRELQEIRAPFKLNVNKNELRSRQLWNIVQEGIAGLGHKAFLSPEFTWFSSLLLEEEKLGNEQVGEIIYEGWHTGISGVLWILNIAQKNGFDIGNVQLAYENSWNYIGRRYLPIRNINTSLYTGSAGIALALSEAINNNMLPPGDTDWSVENCFSKHHSGLILSEGVSGQGIALLKVGPSLDPGYVRDLLAIYADHVINCQRKDGSWDLYSKKEKTGKKIIELDNGVPGIIWFLLCLLQHYPSNKTRIAAIKGLGWLINRAKQAKEKVDRTTFGITLVLIKAYEVTGNNLYRDIAISNLNAFPPHPVLVDFSLSSGLAGIGEVYLEAYRVFRNIEWHDRAEWIVEILTNTSRCRPSGERYWVVKNESINTADLFRGNSGIIHFLMRYLMPDQILHPLGISNRN